MKWWMEKPYRMVQTNLREIDGCLDAAVLVRSLKELEANAVMFSAAGIVANYPTKLKEHYINPFMSGDLLGEFTRACRSEGIKVVARMDFSKLHESIALQHPEWLFVSEAGQIVNSNSFVHTCISGGYQQEMLFQILNEVISEYPIDGIFINMHGGFQTRDYEGVEHGICQCPHCKEQFAEQYAGRILPVQADKGTPAYDDYQQFKKDQFLMHLSSVYKRIKQLNPAVALFNFARDFGQFYEWTDVVRQESNYATPSFIYASSSKVQWVRGMSREIASSCSAVHFMKVSHRHAATSPNLTAIRLAQDIVHGGWLDFYVVGEWNNQEDRVVLERVKKLFNFHHQHESYYTNIVSMADVAMIVPQNSKALGSETEFHGLYRLLAQEHIPFDLIRDSVLEEDGERLLKRYKLLIVPDVKIMSKEAAQQLDRFVQRGGKLLVTGETSLYSTNGSRGASMLLESIGVRQVKAVHTQTKGTYFRISEEDQRTLQNLEELQLLYVSGEFIEYEPSGQPTLLSYIHDAMVGPPEKCYYTEVTDIPGVIRTDYGAGQTVYLPWMMGKLYDQTGYHGYPTLLTGIIKNILHYEPLHRVHAPKCVETCFYQNTSRHSVSFNAVNLTGQMGQAMTEPVPIHDIQVEMTIPGRALRTFTLHTGESVAFEYDERICRVSFTLPKLELMETVIVEYEGKP